MPKMKFNTRVKYKGTVYKGLEPFEVDESDVAEMQKYGGVIINESKSKVKSDREDKPEDEDKLEDKPEDSRKRGKKKAAGDS